MSHGCVSLTDTHPQASSRGALYVIDTLVDGALALVPSLTQFPPSCTYRRGKPLPR